MTMHISLTHLRLKSLWKIYPFYKYNSKVQQQIKSAEGVLSSEAKGTSFVSFYTKTSWKSKDDMLKFMRSGAHVIAMKESSQFALKVTTHGYSSEALPSWNESIQIINNKS